MTEEKIVEIVNKAVRESVDKALGTYQIPKQTHYEQHRWIERMMDYSDRVTNVALKTIVISIVGIFISFLILGFIVWGSRNFK